MTDWLAGRVRDMAGNVVLVEPPIAEPVLMSVVLDLTAADIATLSSAPVTVLAAPGATTVIVPVAGSFVFLGGDEFYDNDRVVIVRWGAYDTILDFGTVTFTGTGSFAPRQMVEQPLGGDLVYFADQPVVVAATADPGSAGNGTARLKVIYYTVDLL